ncbi:MAG: HD domain-containing protein, partial [Myxococcales bacterium]|nr:HD domain-containing protein [Myxococcales bacterium]
LGDAVDSHSEETGDHVRRVAEISKILALAYGLPESEAELIRSASPLHDVGKSGIPDAILHKPGKYSSEEWEIMKTHTLVGWEMLRTSRLPAMRVGAAIALEHHERWDGTGYPHGRAGEEIHLYGRITALADVFDALGSERCYKPAWPLDEMLAFFERERDRQFDARLVDLLFEHLEPIVAIRDRCAEQLGSARCAQGF